MQNDCLALVSKISQSGRRVPPDARHTIANFVCGVLDMPQDILERYAFGALSLDVQHVWPAVQDWKMTETFAMRNDNGVYHQYLIPRMVLQFKTDLVSLELIMGKVQPIQTVHADGRKLFVSAGMNTEIKKAVVAGGIKGLCIDLHANQCSIPPKEAYEAAAARASATAATATRATAAAAEAAAAVPRAARVAERAAAKALSAAAAAAGTAAATTRAVRASKRAAEGAARATRVHTIAEAAAERADSAAAYAAAETREAAFWYDVDVL
jgi:hypothetical protein